MIKLSVKCLQNNSDDVLGPEKRRPLSDCCTFLVPIWVLLAFGACVALALALVAFLCIWRHAI